MQIIDLYLKKKEVEKEVEKILLDFAMKCQSEKAVMTEAEFRISVENIGFGGRAICNRGFHIKIEVQ